MNNRKILYWSIIVTFAGFLFGFDTVVISGADKQLQQLWGSSDLFHGLVVMSSALWGTVIGAIFGAYPTNILGRKKTLIIIGLLAQIVRGYKVEPYWKLSIIQVFTSTFLYFISYHFNNIHYYFILDSFLHIFILLPLSIYFGKFYILKIFKSNSTFVK